jgi:hypothetical protein
VTPADSFLCSCCGAHHEGLPLVFAVEAPAYWSPELEAADPANVLEDEICVIKGQGFFVRGLVEIPIVDTGDVFSWSAWVSLSQDNFLRMLELWEAPGREAEPPYFGWFSSMLPGYPLSTLELKTMVHTRKLGQRPSIELEPTEHPLAVEQGEGITRGRLQEIAETALHGYAAHGQPALGA